MNVASFFLILYRVSPKEFYRVSQKRIVKDSERNSNNSQKEEIPKESHHLAFTIWLKIEGPFLA